MGKREQALKRIHIFGRMYLLLGALDIILIVLSLLEQSGEIKSVIASNGLSMEVNMTALIIFSGFSALIALIKIFVGYQGVSYTLLKPLNKACIPMAKVLFVLSVLSLLCCIPDMIGGNVDFVNICSCVASMSIVYYFLDNIKTLRE